LQAARRVATRWPEIKSLEDFEKVVKEESKHLKGFVDNLIKLGHKQIDSTVEQLDDESVRFFQKVCCF
jgi:hypothetical protein